MRSALLVACWPRSPVARRRQTAGGKPRVTNRCSVNALPLRSSDRPALAAFGLALAPHGVDRAGGRTIDYRGATAKARFPTFYSFSACGRCVRRDSRAV
jgi:hypothetical protein